VNPNKNNYTDNSDHSTIMILNSFNETKEQIDKIEEIIRLIRKKSEIKYENLRQTIITNFDKIREELAKEKNPNKDKISKWLKTIKKTLETLVLSHDTVEAIKWLYKTFNFVFN
jgi:hypothetical protein